MPVSAIDVAPKSMSARTGNGCGSSSANTPPMRPSPVTRSPSTLPLAFHANTYGGGVTVRPRVARCAARSSAALRSFSAATWPTRWITSCRVDGSSPAACWPNGIGASSRVMVARTSSARVSSVIVTSPSSNAISPIATLHAEPSSLPSGVNVQVFAPSLRCSRSSFGCASRSAGMSSRCQSNGRRRTSRSSASSSAKCLRVVHCGIADLHLLRGQREAGRELVGVVDAAAPAPDEADIAADRDLAAERSACARFEPRLGMVPVVADERDDADDRQYRDDDHDRDQQGPASSCHRALRSSCDSRSSLSMRLREREPANSGDSVSRTCAH